MPTRVLVSGLKNLNLSDQQTHADIHHMFNLLGVPPNLSIFVFSSSRRTTRFSTHYRRTKRHSPRETPARMLHYTLRVAPSRSSDWISTQKLLKPC